MPASEAGPLDRVAEQSARWLSARASRRSVLGRVGDRLLTAIPPPSSRPAPAAPSSARLGAVGRAHGGQPHPDPEPGPEPVAEREPEIEREPAADPEPAADSEPAAADPEPAAEAAPAGGPVGTAVAVSAARFPGTAPAVVLAPPHSLVLAIAAPVAAVVDGPLLVINADGTIPPAAAAELARLSPGRRVAVGIDVPHAERIGALTDDLPALSIKAAAFVRQHASSVRAFAVEDTDDGRAVAGLVAAVAAVRRFPVMVGAAAARAGATEGERRAAVTYLVGDLATTAKDVPGGFPLPAPTKQALAPRLAQLAVTNNTAPDSVGLADQDTDPVTLAALAGCGGPILFESPDPRPARTHTPR